MSYFFDFDALDEIYQSVDGSDEKASTSTSCSAGEVPVHTASSGVNSHHPLGSVDEDLDSIDSASEVWPGEEVHEIEDDEASDGHAVWEVVFTPRIVVRREPNLDAEAIRFASPQELFFSDPRFISCDWIKLSVEQGYILKNGRSKAPSLGALIQPFALGDQIPAIFHGAVLNSLRTMWVNVRWCVPNGSFVKPPVIKRLRMGYDGAVAAALNIAGTFSLQTFKEQLSAVESAIVPPLLPTPCGPVQSDSQSPWRFSAPSLSISNARDVNVQFFLSLVNDMRDRILPCTEDIKKLVSLATELFAQEQTLVRLEIPAGATLHVVGDLHGQFWDFCHIVDLFGSPSRKNWYLFNGDFVDRGQFSVEVVIALFAMKVALPECVHLNRGNHESLRMNALYGFMGETQKKYCTEIFDLFVKAFKSLPLATLVNNSVLVVHGGLPRRDGVQLKDIECIDRVRELDEGAPDLMIDLLWSDPMNGSGRYNSPRGAGFLFGCDVTERFCDENDLICVIRSHEMKFEGFEWLHDERCLTIFSAANYCDICGNFGAVCNITPHQNLPRIVRSDLSIQRFEASPHPNEPRCL